MIMIAIEGIIGLTFRGRSRPPHVIAFFSRIIVIAILTYLLLIHHLSDHNIDYKLFQALSQLIPLASHNALKSQSLFESIPHEK